MRSLAAEISRHRLYQTIGAVSTEKVNSSQDFPRLMMKALNTKKVFAKDYMGRIETDQSS